MNDAKDTYYAITPMGYVLCTKRPFIQIDGDFNVLEAERSEPPDGMKYKVEILTGTSNRNFYKDLDEIISTRR